MTELTPTQNFKMTIKGWTNQRKIKKAIFRNFDRSVLHVEENILYVQEQGKLVVIAKLIDDKIIVSGK